MKRILIFAGTTEGREIAAFLEEKGIHIYVSTATEYGRECIGEMKHAEVFAGRMDEEQMRQFLWEKEIDLVIDATHPFAVLVTQNIQNACRREAVEYVRCLREQVSREAEQEIREYTDGTVHVVHVDSVPEAVEYLNQTEGNILITTGSKELREYTAIPEYQKRCYARVLSTEKAVQDSISLGFEGKHLIAMQGPFSEELNCAMIRHVDAAYFVTKESGKAGGFPEKVRAAGKTGTILVVIGRPRETGMCPGEVRKFLEKRLL